MKRPMLALIAHDSQKNALTQLAAEEEYRSAMSTSLPPRPPEKPSQGLDTPRGWHRSERASRRRPPDRGRDY